MLRNLLIYNDKFSSSATFFDWYCRYGCVPQALTFPYYDRPMFGSGESLVPIPERTIVNQVQAVVEPQLSYQTGDPYQQELENYQAVSRFMEENPEFIDWHNLTTTSTTTMTTMTTTTGDA